MLKLLPIFICKGREDTAQFVKVVGSQVRQRLVAVRALWRIAFQQIAKVRVAMYPVTIVHLKQLADLPPLRRPMVRILCAQHIVNPSDIGFSRSRQPSMSVAA